jgi:hypothetical protein
MHAGLVKAAFGEADESGVKDLGGSVEVSRVRELRHGGGR